MKLFLVLFLLGLSSVLADERSSVIEKARDFTARNDFNSAKKIYKDFLKQHPQDIEIIYLLANIHSWDKDYEKAIDLYQTAAALKPDYLPALLGPIKILSWQKNYDLAITRLDILSKKFPKNPEIYNLKAKILSWKKEIKKSLAYYKAALKIEPENQESMEGLATLYRWLEMSARELYFLKKLLKKNPSNPDYFFYTALAYRKLRKHRTALQYFRRAKSLPGADQDRLDAEILFTRTLLEQNRQDKTRLKENLALDKADVEQFIQQGRVYSWQQKNAKAIALFHKALKKSPRHIDALLGLGNTYYFAGRWDDALSVFRRADRIKPGDQEIQNHIEKVEKLMRPFFQLQYRRFSFEDSIKANSLNYTQETTLDRYSLIYKQNLSSRFDIRGEYHRETLENKDSDLGLSNYQLQADILGFESNYHFKNQYDLRLKLFYGRYEDKNPNENIFLMGKTESTLTGYTLLRKQWERHYFSFSLARDNLYQVKSSDLSVQLYKLTSADLLDSIEFTEQFTTTFGIAANQVEVTDRKYYIYSIKPQYRPKSLKNFETAFEFKTQEENLAPDFSTSTLSFSYYRNIARFFFDFTTAISFTSFDDTYAHDNRLTLQYSLPWQLVLSSELSYYYEFSGDEDKSTSLLFNIGRSF